MSAHSPESLPKTDATPKQIGFCLVDFIVKSGKSQDVPDQALASSSENDQDNLRQETMLLVGWINEYATWDVFRDRPEKNAILAAYYSLVDALALKDPNWRTFDTELRKRIPSYAEAVKGGLHKAQLEEIGWAYARFCGHPNENLFQIRGTIAFTASYAATTRFLSSLNVIL